VLQAEVEWLAKTNWPEVDLRFLDSMLHMSPDKLSEHLNSLVQGELRQGHNIILVYGDCCLGMAAMEQLPGVVRVRGSNCCAQLLGSAEYRRLSHGGSFFLLPEWARRWQRVFSLELGLNHDNAKSLMGDMHRKLVYLDTGVVPVPEKELRECSHYCGLPWEVLNVSLEPLRIAIDSAVHLFDEGVS
jgi:hypothetical protein